MSDLANADTLKDRSPFAADVIKSVREAVGPDMPIALRVRQWRQQDFDVRLAHTPEEMAAWLAPLVEAGAPTISVGSVSAYPATSWPPSAAKARPA